MDCSSFFSQLFQPGTAPYLAMIVVALVIARATDQVFYYRIAIAMSPYSWYFSSCILPIAFLIIVWPIVGAKLIWYPKHITKEMLAIPQHKFAVLGALDTAYNLLSTWPIKATGSTVANVLAQSVLPINMVMSFVVLRTRYTGQHMSGALLVIYGVLLRLLPALQDSSDEGDGDDEVPAGAFLAWSVVLVGSQIFAALSNVYKEVALKGTEDVDVYYMNACISSWQLLFGILTAPLVGLKFTPDYVPLSELGTYISNANKCFFGHNAVAGDVCDADSASPMAIFCIFIAFNLTYNILMLEIFKRGSSVLFVVASAVRLPLVDILLLWPLLAGVATATFTSFDAFALVALLLAMYLYNSQPEIKSKRPPLGLQELWGGFVRHCLCCECGCLEQVLEGGEHGDGETRGLLDNGAAGSGSGSGLGKGTGGKLRLLAAAPGATGMAVARASYLDEDEDENEDGASASAAALRSSVEGDGVVLLDAENKAVGAGAAAAAGVGRGLGGATHRGGYGSADAAAAGVGPSDGSTGSSGEEPAAVPAL